MIRIGIDGDLIPYRCGFSSQKSIYRSLSKLQNFGEGVTFSQLQKLEFWEPGDDLELYIDAEPVENALFTTKNFIGAIHDKLRLLGFHDYQTHLFMTADGAKNHRYDIAKQQPYKSSRKKPSRWEYQIGEDGKGRFVPDPNSLVALRPVHYAAIREYIGDQYSPTWVIEYEADDAMATFAEDCRTNKDEFLLVHVDKDLNQIPGKHYNPITNELYDMNELQALQFFYRQMLTGDSVDDIKGVLQIGKKIGFGPAMSHKFIDYLTTEEEMWNVIIKHYNEQYQDSGEDVATETGQLLYLSKFIGDIWKNPNQR